MDETPIVEPIFHGHVRRTFLLLQLLGRAPRMRADLSAAEIAKQLAIAEEDAAAAVAALLNLRCIEIARSTARAGAISWRALPTAALPRSLGALCKAAP